MARKGISEQEIRDAIAQLENTGQAINVKQIREVLGTGSFSTISAVLQRWRDEQTTTQKLNIPEVPAQVSGMFQKVWAEAWTLAYSQHESERRSFLEQKQASADLEKEMKQEITQLENEIDKHLKEIDSLRDLQMELVKVQAKADAFKLELSEVREERSRQSDKLAEWVEKATKAEAELQQLKKRKTKSA